MNAVQQDHNDLALDRFWSILFTMDHSHNNNSNNHMTGGCLHFNGGGPPQVSFNSSHFGSQSSSADDNDMMMDTNCSTNMASNSATIVYMSGLHPSFTSAHVEKLFRPFGLIVSIRVVYGKGQAVVEMAHEESARLAAAKLNGRMLLGTILHVQTKQQGEVGWNKRLLQEQTTNMQDLSAMMAPYRSVRRKFHE